MKLLNDNILLQKDVTTLRNEVSETCKNASSNVSELQKIVKLLKLDLEKMVNGSKNLYMMFGGQKPYLDKIGLGFEKESDDEKSSKESQNNIPACIYCYKKRHTSRKCFSRRKAKTQKVKRPKKSTNPKGPKKIWVPKVKIISNVVVSEIISLEGNEVVSGQWMVQAHDWKQILVQKPQTQRL